MRTNDNNRFWFRAKTQGWGWGLPARWEGWLFFAVWLLALTVGTTWIAYVGLVQMIVFIAVMAVVAVAVCYLKGEPPQWR